MSYESHSFPFEDALARNNDVYEVEFPSWGVRNGPTGTPNINLQYPPINMRALASSVAAVAIGPRSTIDRCWISWDRAKTLNVPPADVPLPSNVISLPRIITAEAPLLFPQATRKGTLATQSWWDAMQSGLAYVFPFGPKPENNTVTDGSGVNGQSGQFGRTTIYESGLTTYTNMFGVTGVFAPYEAPFLQLLLYAKLPTFAPATKRAIMLRSNQWAALGGGGTTYAAIYPIYGRKHVSISIMSHAFDVSPAQICDYRVGLIRNLNENPVGSFSPTLEVKAAEALAAPANTGVNFSIPNPGADYVSVHVTNNQVGNAGGAVTIVAED